MKRRWWIVGLGIALIVAVLSPLASVHPDGLERVAEDQGFIDRSQGPSYELLPDYLFPGVANESVATILAGVVGTIILFALVFGLGRIMARRGSPS